MHVPLKMAEGRISPKKRTHVTETMTATYSGTRLSVFVVVMCVWRFDL